ncbi:MAG: cytochrome c-type biogenesis protein CcmH [Proteobacteria bacterium]|nr:cytochrome c-type biogenesis protein CcmH [Pseudomonadota bacterium]
MRYSLIVTALVAAALLGFSPGPAQAILAGEALDDPVLEARARDIGKGLRCLVCQNQSIDDSNAPLAKDLRRLVRERLEAGESDQQVMDYIVARYGDYVLLKPPFKPITYALWLGPGLMLLVAGAGVVVFLRRQSRRAPTAEAPLDDDERRRLASMLDDA